MPLAPGEQRVEHAADVVDDAIAHDLDAAGLESHLHHADVTPVGEGLGARHVLGHGA